MTISLPLIRQADQVFRSVMLKEWGAPDRIECFTCHSDFDPEYIDVGHVVKRERYLTRWLRENVRPQCRACNRGLHGNGIEKRIPPAEYEELRALANAPDFRLTDDFVKEIIQMLTLIDNV